MGFESLKRNVPEFLQLTVGQDGLVKPNLSTMCGGRIEHVPRSAKERGQGHHRTLTDGVNGWVADLGKFLPEIMGQVLRPFTQSGQRIVRAHGANRLFALFEHREQHPLKLFLRVPVIMKAVLVSPSPRGFEIYGGQISQTNFPLRQPLSIGLCPTEGVLELIVLDDSSLSQIHNKHLPGLKAALFQHIFRRHRKRPRLRRHDNPTVLGQGVPRGPEAIPIQQRANDGAVGERNGGWAVPGFHEVGVITVEVLFVLGHVVVPLEGFWHHHHHGVRQRASRIGQNFDDVVQVGAVGALDVANRVNELELLLCEQAVLEQRRLAAHSIDVARNGVDFTIV